MTTLAVEGIHVRLDGRSVLSDVTFNCEGGSFVGLLGPNGAGKSTLLKVLAGLVDASDGAVHVDGVSASELSSVARAKAIAYLPQDRAIHWPVDVETVVKLGRLPHRTFLKRTASVDAEIIRNAMRQAEVEELRARTATKLSGGEQARVLLARVLAQQAGIVLADEPTSALDFAHQISVMETLSNLTKSGAIVVAAIHDLNLAARWCDRLLVLRDGRLVSDGPPNDVLSRDLMRDVYGVEGKISKHDGRPVVIPTELVEHSGATS